MLPSNRNLATALQCKSDDWFLYGGKKGLRWVKKKQETHNLSSNIMFNRGVTGPPETPEMESFVIFAAKHSILDVCRDTVYASVFCNFCTDLEHCSSSCKVIPLT